MLSDNATWLSGSVTRERGLSILFSGSLSEGYSTAMDGRTIIQSATPYFTTSSVEFDLLLSDTGYQKVLGQLGYDSILLVSNAAEVLKALPFDEKQVRMVDGPVQLTGGERDLVTNVYHATNEFFTSFKHGDIGFHFGTRKAALQRAKSIYRPEDVEVVAHTTQQGQNHLYDFIMSESKSEEEELVKLILRKVQNPDISRVQGAFKKISATEYESIRREYEEQPDSQKFIQMKERSEHSGVKAKYQCEVSGVAVSLNTNKELKMLKATIEQSFMKKASLVLNNPYRMMDMGTWDVVGVAYQTDALDSKEKQDIAVTYREKGVEAAVELYQSKMNEKGYDGIVYENAVEDKGKESYIVFRADQVILLPHREKLYGSVVKLSNESAQFVM